MSDTILTDTITLSRWDEPIRTVGVGDEVVISDIGDRLSVATITELTKTTIKTTKGTFARKSLREYGKADSWNYARIVEMNPVSARETVKRQQIEDARLKAYRNMRERVHAESANLTADDIAAIVVILDEAAKRKDEDRDER